MTQAESILSYMKKSSITSIDALKLFGCFRLAARIKDLRNKGHLIHTEIIKENGKQYARYWLLKKVSSK